MENRDDLRSIIPFLPLTLQSSSLVWPSQVVEALKALSRGPDHSRVDSGEVLFLAISDLRNALGLSSELLVPSAAEGYALFFDEFMSRVESMKWFREIIPAMAALLLRLPSLLEAQYQNADDLLKGRNTVGTGLRLLDSQEAGIVVLSQELIGALITSSFFCLFPILNRGAKHLPAINFDLLFACLYENYTQSQEHKIKCLVHYFERIFSCMPTGLISFERKVLPLKHSSHGVSYPKIDFWRKSVVSLCQFEVSHSGLIENQSNEAVEVDFANKYIGGGALGRGCVQEEIRFMISPELIVGMLFLPSMADNEAIEIVGPERFSSYTGYASSFRFSGNHVDKRKVDFLGRRKTRIIAIDALCSPKMRQYCPDYVLREINKAFCGFLNQSKFQQYQSMLQEDPFCRDQTDQEFDAFGNEAENLLVLHELNEGTSGGELMKDSQDRQNNLVLDHQNDIGIVTGNWGCGAFGGNPELKAVIQWLAASQALRPFISYCTFGEEALSSLNQVSEWILLHEWKVGDLWHMLMEYSSQRLKGETSVGFFSWLLPSSPTMMSD